MIMKKFTKKHITVLALTLLGMYGSPEKAAAQACSPVYVPYFENFDSVTAPTLPNCLEVDDLDGDGITWVNKWWGDNALNQELESGQSDDWFYTKGIRLNADSLYMLQFAYTGLGSKGGKGVGFANMAVHIGSTKDKATMQSTTALFENLDFVKDLNILDTVTIYFRPATTGVWYFGFYCSSLDKSSIRLDDIRVDKAPSNYIMDTRLISIVDPAVGSEVCPDNSADVRVAVSNTGVDTLTNIPVHLSVAGSVKTQTLSGPLAPGATDTVRFSGVDLSNKGTVTLTTYTKLTGDEFAGNDSLNQDIIVIDAPTVAGVTAMPEGGLKYRFAVTTATDVTNWEWDFGDGNSGTGNNPVHTYTAEGNYDVVAKGSNGCNWDTAAQVFEILEVSTGIEGNEQAGTWTIYPNPAREQMTIRNAGGALIHEVVVYNSTGSVVYQSGAIAVGQQAITISHWAAGIYLVRVRVGETYATQRVEVLQ